MGRKNALAAQIFDPDDTQNPLQWRPSPADAYSYNAPIVKEAVSGAVTAAQDPQTWVDAANQWGQAMIAGTAGPKGMLTAPEKGFTRVYHGGSGTNPYDDSPAGMMGVIKSFRFGPEGAAFFAADPHLASDYAVARYPERSTVYPIDIDTSNMLEHDQSKVFKTNADLINEAKKNGNTVIASHNTDDNVPGGKRPLSTVYMALHPDAIRFPFADKK